MESAVLARQAEILGDTLGRFVRRGARSNISKMLGKVRPEDVALALRSLLPADRLEVFRILIADHPSRAAEVMVDMEGSQRLELIEQLEVSEIVDLLGRIPVDDAVFVVETLPADLHEKVLELVDLKKLSSVQAQLSYSDDSAGRVMVGDFFAMPESATVREVIAKIQAGVETEMMFYLYVVDKDRHLVGVVSLRQLLLSRPERMLREVMNKSVIKVDVDTDQEEVAQLAARYDLLAIPVTDDKNRLVGIVTVDDIIDIVKEEATEDFFKMVGTSENELLYQDRPVKVVGLRLPWLLFTLFGSMVSGRLLEHFQISLREALFLLAFAPVITAMGGNVATQSSTITVRGLATGRIGPETGRIRHFLWQQLKVGFLLAVLCAVVVMVAAYYLQRNPYYGVVVGTSLFLAMLLASMVGVLIPLVFRRLSIDPAVASGPLVTTTNDITGLVIYFGLAGLLIGLLVR